MIKYKHPHTYIYLTHCYNSLTITTFYNMKILWRRLFIWQFHLLTHSYYHHTPPHEAYFWLQDCRILVTCIGP